MNVENLASKDQETMRPFISNCILLSSCLILITLVSACEKPPITYRGYAGKVLNLTSDKRLAGVEVVLIEEHIPMRPFSPISQTALQVVETDSFGNFEFLPIVRYRRNRNYYIKMADDWSYALDGWQGGEYETVVAEIPIERSGHGDLELKVVPLGKFSVVFDISTSDSVHVEGVMSNGKIEIVLANQYFHRLDYRFTGNITMPADTYEIEWRITQNGQVEVRKEVFDLPFASEETLEFIYE